MVCAFLIGSEWTQFEYRLKNLSGAARDQENKKLFNLLCNRMEEFSCIGDFGNLQKAMNVLSHTLQLPYMAIPATRLNASGADHTQSLSREQLESISFWGDIAFKFYEKASAYADRQYKIRFPDSDSAGLASRLNARYRTAVFEKMPLCRRVDLKADRAWPGYGWGIRLKQGALSVRKPGDSSQATLFCRLVPQHYILSLRYSMLSSPEAARTIVLTANGIRCPARAGNFDDDGTYLQHFFVPRKALQETDATVDFNFSFPATHVQQSGLSISQVTVLPVET